MKPASKQIGHRYEALAADYLQQQGSKILARNFYCKGGELDLIILDQQTLAFVEVKFRQNTNHGHPSEFITPTKQQRLQRCAQVYLQKNPAHQTREMRFDSLSIIGEPAQIDWQKNILCGW